MGAVTALADWQHGYDLDHLRRLAAMFDTQRAETLGRHELPNEATIAAALHARRCIIIDDHTIAIYRVMTRDSDRADFTGLRTATIKKGDCVIDHIASTDLTPSVLHRLLSTAGRRTVWFRPLSHQTEIHAALTRLAYMPIITQISASSDIRTLLTNDTRRQASAPLDDADTATLHQIVHKIPTGTVSKMLAEATALDSWADHYSVYNLRKSWSAISLHGFGDDPADITKPNDMAQSWKAANAHRLADQIRPTAIAALTPNIMRTVTALGWRTERIRLMRLRADDGGLSRHADIVDRDAGTADGRIARLHIPLQTDPHCQFTGWTLDGSQTVSHLPTGTLWYLDIRKPHAVTNVGSTIDRIHLVVDVHADSRLRAALT